MVRILDAISLPLGRLLLSRKLPDDLLTAQLEKAARGDVCPICTMDAEARYISLWSLMWENVNDPDAREEFIKGGGLCPRDNWSMVEVARTKIKSSLGAAILYEHLAKVTGRALRQAGGASHPWIDTRRWIFHVGQGCQACTTGQAAIRRSVRRLSLASVVKRPPDWLRDAFPLCYSHIRLLLREASSVRARRSIAALQRDRIQYLQADSGTPGSGPRKGPPRLDASLFPRGSPFPVPEGSQGLYRGATERCPICESLALREQELLDDGLGPEENSSPAFPCLGHYLALARNRPTLRESLRSDRLEKEVRAMDMETVPPGPTAETGHLLERAWKCPLCQRRADAEKEALRSKGAEWAGGTGPDDLLCLHHLGRALAETSGRERERLLQAQLERLSSMRRELQGFIAVHDYRSPQRPPEGPDAPYRWALRFFTSEPALVAPLLGVGEARKSLPSKASYR